MSKFHNGFVITAIAASALLAGCHDDQLPPATTSAGKPVPTGDTVALSASGKVVTFNRGSLAKLVSTQPITGLKSGENFLGIDVRPADKLIYGVTNQGNLYTLDDSTGISTFKFALTAGAATTATCAGGAPGTFSTLNGTEFAFDFNPVADRLRMASDKLQDLRINVADGTVVVDCPISYTSGTSGTPKPTAAAYTPASTATPPTTTLYYIDSGSDMLYTIDTSNNMTANNGVIKPVGSLGTKADGMTKIDINDINGFDIDASGKAYGVFTVGGSTSFYTIDLTTGAATDKVNFVAGESLRGLALK